MWASHFELDNCYVSAVDRAGNNTARGINISHIPAWPPPLTVPITWSNTLQSRNYLTQRRARPGLSLVTRKKVAVAVVVAGVRV